MKATLILPLAVLLSSSSIAQVTDGLFAEYMFDDGTANASVGSADGTVYDAYLAYDRFGCPDRAYQFVPADNSYISLGDNFNTEFATPDSSWSVSGWFKLSDETAVNKIMFGKHSTGLCGENERQFVIRKSPEGYAEILYHTTSSWADFVRVRGSTLLDDTLWHHLVVNYNGSLDGGSGLDRVEMYLDNVPETMVLQDLGGSFGDIQAGLGHAGFGIPISSTGVPCTGSIDQFWKGYLDDYKLYNRELLAFEVDLLYNVDNSCCTLPDDSISVDPGVITVYQLGATYQWIDCASLSPISGEVNQFFFPPADGFYACIIDLDGCIDTTDCVEFHFNAIEENPNGEVKIYPNPTRGDLRIELYQFNSQVQLSVIDLQGKLVEQINQLSAVTYLDLSHLRSGTYVLKFLSEEGLKSERLIIE